MRVTKMECRGFRCLTDIAFYPEPGLNVLYGANAQGKTSLLEAILYASTSKSHRTGAEAHLVAHGQPGFRIALLVDRADRDVHIEAIWWEGAKRFKVNGIAQSRISDILGRINVVFFSPEDVGLIKDSATARRRFMDMELSQLHPGYLTALQQYRQVLRQRNELLRTPKPDGDLLSVWDTQLVHHGATLMKRRASFIRQLSGLATQAYAQIAGQESLDLTYQPDIKDGQGFEEVLLRGRASDIRRQNTLHGPHRDDLEIQIEGHPARNYGSQGQQKTAALALKLAEMQLIHARVGEYPILMLDEVLAELDPQRAKQLFTSIPDEVQLLVTTTETGKASRSFGRPASNFTITGGSIEET